jgi:hypothetical protein
LRLLRPVFGAQQPSVVRVSAPGFTFDRSV